MFGGRPFAVADALDAQVSEGRLRAAVRVGTLVRVRHGILRVAAAASAEEQEAARVRHLTQVRSTMRVLRYRDTVSHASAVAVHGGPHPVLAPIGWWPVEITGPRGRPHGRGWRRHHDASARPYLVLVDGLPVTSLVRTVLDVARTRSLPEALIVVDWAMRRVLMTRAGEYGAQTSVGGRDPAPGGVHADRPGIAGVVAVAERHCVRLPELVTPVRVELEAALLAEPGVPGCLAAARALAAADPAAENGFESYSRGVLLAGGVPRPEVGYSVMGSDGRTYWADAAWPEHGVLGEADGRLKYTDPRALYAEKQRQEALEDTGWRVVRWTFDEMLNRPDAVVRRVALALDRGPR